MVEIIEKKEFCKKYASKTHQKSIKSAAILSYICAAFFLVYGLYTNISVLLDVVLVVGLALGIQFAKSRVCAVLLLIYVCSNAIIAFLSSGKIEGWLLIAAGIEAVRGTFGLHKEYRKFLKDGTLPANEEYRKFPQSGTVGANVAPPQEALTKGKLSALFIPPLGMVAGLLVIMLSLSPVCFDAVCGERTISGGTAARVSRLVHRGSDRRHSGIPVGGGRERHFHKNGVLDDNDRSARCRIAGPAAFLRRGHDRDGKHSRADLPGQ